ncbi:MAG: hypothetical protein PHG65_08435, partial [Kiritimatiellae bacterium]|nr:hypothetical protein [Kiritimatiellia bacterium]
KPHYMQKENAFHLIRKGSCLAAFVKSAMERVSEKVSNDWKKRLKSFQWLEKTSEKFPMVGKMKGCPHGIMQTAHQTIDLSRKTKAASARWDLFSLHAGCPRAAGAPGLLLLRALCELE